MYCPHLQGRREAKQAVHSSETSVHFYLTTRRYNPEDSNILHNHRRESISSHIVPGGLKYTVSQEERSIFWEVIVSVILSRKMYMYMCPIPNGFRDGAISLYSSKIVDKKEILCKK
jgi:hypothetical protein